MYTLRELFDNLDITMTELKRRSGISDVTLISIRNGKSARRSTINKLLKTFSDIYGVKLTLKNVRGIIIQGQPVNIVDDVPSVSPISIDDSTPQEELQISTVEPKRAYVRHKDTDLPPGSILASKFAKTHKVALGTFYGHMNTGKEGKKVDYSSRPKPGREHEQERYLTSDQQRAVLDFWKRHDVGFSQCDNPDCPCHQ